MRTSDFWYDLPQERIAQTPTEPRDHSRLLCMDRATGRCTHRHFYEIADLLRPGDLLVMNDSRVIPARLLGEKEGSGGAMEFLLLEQKGKDEWETLVRPGGKARGEVCLWQWPAESGDKGSPAGRQPDRPF